MNIDYFEQILIEDIKTPRQGYICFKDKWWSSDGNYVFIFTRGGCYSPQCNSNKSIVDRFSIKGTKPVFIPVAFVNPKSCYS